MKFGIHYIYWRKDLDCKSYLPYVEKAKKAGFDALELGDYLFFEISDHDVTELAKAAQYYDIELALGLDPPAGSWLTSFDREERRKGIEFYKKAFPRMEKLGIKAVGGNMLNAPFTAPYDKYHEKEYEFAIDSIRKIAGAAKGYDIGINVEIVNRYESHIINTAAQAKRMLDEIDMPNAGMTLDSFHMNVEESSYTNAILTAGGRLGHFHLMENHRGILGTGHLPLNEFRDALHYIHYDGILTMECLVRAGGSLGDCCRIWRDMTRWADEAGLDEQASQSVHAMKYLFAEGNR
ncbi:sugar phosphate isomerase/epimerase [Faecalicatena orotica]|uniref:D-psicose/D-tagatose/L-ribulose 3-epimerase n=1 Tax=Faecalicatena orotica TaxID=1544 RepID=A0A2Y9BFZ3_9FIRM|nr:sugar phosphate isomerase/epimerase family protein [Faecalicatena orotica]PWJ28602.1 D-psicose/D-tagatose/L-ribulose 3-epimerase [Faecalicatena orotica]SSA56423.1 D-psicose/D-tagatose/L-ribulose 3-epimerase [Faecalicatena orotica]